MNDINEMPPKCQYCPYWEVCEYPWVCPDREQLATNLKPTCNQLATDTISRQAAIKAIKEDKIDLTNQNVVAVFKATGDFEKVETQVMTCDRHIKILKDLPSAQPEPCEYYALCRHGRDENKLRTRLGFCEYCNEDADGFVTPIEKNGHAFVRFGINGWELSMKANGWHGSAKIRYCPMCGRDLFVK